MGFKLGNTKAVAAREDEGTWFHVHNELGDPEFYGPDNDKPVRMKVAGSYSNRFNRLNDRMQGRQWKPGTTKQDIETVYREEVVAGCILDWEGFEDETGAPAQLDAKRAKEAVGTPWLYPQIARAMDDHRSFFKESSTN